MKRKKLFTLAVGGYLILVLVAMPFLAACAAPEGAAPTPAAGLTGEPPEVWSEYDPQVIKDYWKDFGDISHYRMPILPPEPTAWYPEPEFEIKMVAAQGSLESLVAKYNTVVVARLIEEATFGRAEVNVYGGGTLAKPPEVFRKVQEGVVDFGRAWGPSHPGVFPLHEIVTLPGLFPNSTVSNLVLNELARRYPQFGEQFNGVKWLCSQAHMRSDLHSSVPIRTIADLKGKVIGCQDAMSAEALTALGASASQMSAPDIYSALERGVVDGAVVAWGSVEMWKLYEVASYHTLISICPAHSHWMWSLDSWNKLTPEEQLRIEWAIPWLQYFVQLSGAEASMQVREQRIYADPNQEIIELSPADQKAMRDAFRPIWDKWAQEMEEKGYPGRDILRDAEKLIEGYKYG